MHMHMHMHVHVHVHMLGGTDHAATVPHTIAPSCQHSIWPSRHLVTAAIYPPVGARQGGRARRHRAAQGRVPAALRVPHLSTVMSGRFKSSNRVFPDHLITLKSSAQRFGRSLLFIVPVSRIGIFCILSSLRQKVGKGPFSRQPGGENYFFRAGGSRRDAGSAKLAGGAHARRQTRGRAACEELRTRFWSRAALVPADGAGAQCSRAAECSALCPVWGGAARGYRVAARADPLRGRCADKAARATGGRDLRELFGRPPRASLPTRPLAARPARRDCMVARATGRHVDCSGSAFSPALPLCPEGSSAAVFVGANVPILLGAVGPRIEHVPPDAVQLDGGLWRRLPCRHAGQGFVPYFQGVEG